MLYIPTYFHSGALTEQGLLPRLLFSLGFVIGIPRVLRVRHFHELGQCLK